MLGPPRHSFFLIPPFQNLGLKVVPPAESVGGGGGSNQHFYLNEKHQISILEDFHKKGLQ